MLTVLEYLEVKDTGKSYMFDGKRLSKDKLNKIEVEIYSSRLVKGFSYVLEEDVEKYKQHVYDEVINKLNEYNDELQKIIENVSSWSGTVKTRIIE